MNVDISSNASGLPIESLNKRSVRPASSASTPQSFESLLSSASRARRDENPETPLLSRPLKPLTLSDLSGGTRFTDPASLKPIDLKQTPATQNTSPLRPLNEMDHVPGVKASLQGTRDPITVEAEKWVSQTFFGAMLRQMRNSPFKSEMFSGGRGGQAFNEMFDQTLADRMARGAGGKLVKAVVRSLQAKTGVAIPALPTPGSSDLAPTSPGVATTSTSVAPLPTGAETALRAQELPLQVNSDPQNQWKSGQDGAARGVLSNDGNRFRHVRIHVAPNLVGP